MPEAMVRFSPGDTVTLTYWRDGQRYTTNATLRNRDGKTALTKAPINPDAIPGVELMPTPDPVLEALELRSAVSVRTVTPDSPFGKAGIAKDFVILNVNGNRVSTPDQVETIYRQLMQAPERDRVMFITGAYPTGRIAHFAVPL